jgi:hypothetical protein
MARIRSLKPEFWNDVKMARASRDARLLYMALWNQADEHARCYGDTRWIKGHCLPYDDDLDLAAIDTLLGELAEHHRIQRYEVDGEPFLYLPKLAQHQRLEPAKTPSRLPKPPDPEKIPERSENFPEQVTNRSRTTGDGASPQVTHPIEKIPERSENFPERSGTIAAQHGAGSMEHGAGSMGVQGGVVANATRPPIGTRIADDFAITDALRTWARIEVPGLDIDTATKQFVLHFQAASGQVSRKVRWDAAWKKWMVTDNQRNQTRNGRATKPPVQDWLR